MSSLFDDFPLPESFRALGEAGKGIKGEGGAGARAQSGGARGESDACPPPDEWDFSEDAPPEDWETAFDEQASQSPNPGAGASFEPVPDEPEPVRHESFAAWGGRDEAALEEIVEGLNPPQREAVEHRGSPLLIVAGAGSGKTRVLTRRIAHLLRSGEALPGEILAITFTNKAASEMKERVEALIGPAARYMWVSTFHSACVRILRRDAAAAGLKSTFSIYDSADSKRLITNIAKDMGLDSKRHSPRAFQAKISSLKNELVTPEEYAAQAGNAKNPAERMISQIYTQYQERLRTANAVDFDDLIALTVRLLAENPGIREGYRRRFRHVLVDEYQDTNTAQYRLVRELVGDDPHADLTVVGDSDQSIYAFRGATIRNIIEFEQDFPSARTIVLEQNYRSTQTILSAANAVIKENQGRRPKKLWTDQGEGQQITLYVADDEQGEARYITRQIDALIDEGAKAGDIAVFYRANAQSRALEDQLIRVGLPYKVVGGTRFYERREIKDAIAYLRVLTNPADEINLRRILNTPKRGIGERAEAAVSVLAEQERISFGEALERASEAPGIATRSLGAIEKFVSLMSRVREKVEKGEGPSDVLEEILSESGYYASLQSSDDPQDESRLENLAELVSVAADFEADLAAAEAAASEFEDEPGGPEAPSGSLVDQFLEKVSLVADSDQIPEGEDQFVTLMTLHTAKGLEFPIVFLTGMEDGTFPHQRTLADPKELEEERRLAYVGITRARERLFITRASVRAAWGTPQFFPASRFLEEIPEALVHVARAGNARAYADFGGGFGGGFGSSDGWGASSRRGPSVTGVGVGGGRRDVSRPSFGSGKKAKTASEIPNLEVGDRVTHDSFGMGTVVSASGAGEKLQVEVQFREPHGKKRLLVRYAPITKL